MRNLQLRYHIAARIKDFYRRSNINGSRKYIVEWKKTDTKSYRLYDFFYLNYKNRKDYSMVRSQIIRGWGYD